MKKLLMIAILLPMPLFAADGTADNAPSLGEILAEGQKNGRKLPSSARAWRN